MGFERMKLATITLTVSALANGLFSPLLVYLGYGAFGVMIGHTVGSVASGITAVALLYFSIIRKLPLVSHAKRNIVQNLKPLLRYGIPLSVGSIIAGISPQINSFVMASYVKLSFIGNYRIAANFAVLLDFFIYPIQTVLFPAFSKIDASTDKTRLKNVFSTSVKYSSLFITPATMALIVLSTPIIGTIYATKWPFAPIYLSLHALGYLTVLLGNLNYTQLLYATGETKFILKLNAFKLCLGVPMAFLLIPPFGIIGLISQSLFVGVPTMIGGLYWTWKRYGVKADMHNSGRILLASTIASALTYLFLSFFVADTWIMLLSGFLLFLAVYLISAPLIGAINQADISNFRVMFSGLGPISKILKAILAILEKPLRVKDKISKNRLQ